MDPLRQLESPCVCIDQFFRFFHDYSRASAPGGHKWMLSASSSKFSVGQRALAIVDLKNVHRRTWCVPCSSPNTASEGPPQSQPNGSDLTSRLGCTISASFTSTSTTPGPTDSTSASGTTVVSTSSQSCAGTSVYTSADSSTTSVPTTTSPITSVSSTTCTTLPASLPVSASRPLDSSTPRVISTSTSTTSGSTSLVPLSTLSAGSVSSARRAHPGAIAGGVVAALIAITCFFLLLHVLRRRRLAKQHNLKIQPFPFPSVFAAHKDTSGGRQYLAHGHDLSSPELCNPLPTFDSQLSNRTSMPSGDTSITSSQNNKLPLHSIAQWAAEELPRQHEILLRENEEFWEEIEQLREENERLKLREDSNPSGALPVDQA